jgi:SprT protein
MQKYRNILQKYLPEKAVEEVYKGIVQYKIHLRITKNRSTKLGDYRPAINGQPHRISINHNLNPYSFLITLIHEAAHLVVFENFNPRGRPHGKEWKYCFRELMDPYFGLNIFPYAVQIALKNYLKNPGASSNANLTLARILKKYDVEDGEGVFIEELPDGALFKTHNGRAFERQEQRRKRIKCLCTDNKKLYLFDPLIKVFPLSHNENE